MNTIKDESKIVKHKIELVIQIDLTPNAARDEKNEEENKIGGKKRTQTIIIIVLMHIITR